MRDFRELVEICKGRSVYIQTHNFPDADAVGSAFGVKQLLAHFGIPATICYAGTVGRKATAKMFETFGIEAVPYEDLQDQLREEDYIICVDSQKDGGNITDFIGSEIACIDHHPISSEAEYLYSDIVITGACASLVSSYYYELGLAPDMDTATALLYGLKMDTGNFTREVTPLDIHMFAFLFPLADHQRITSLENSSIQLEDLKAYGNAFENIRVFHSTAFARISFDCPDGLISAVSEFVLALEEVETAIVYSVRPEGWKFSIRTERPDVHAGALAHAALADVGNGGGHASMAGGFVSHEKMEEMEKLSGASISERFLKVLGEKA